MLKHKIAIFIPSTVDGNQPAPSDLIHKMVQWAKMQFANRFGGFTVTQATGGYISPVHGLIEEEITIVASYCNDDDLSNVQEIRDFAAIVAKTMTQESVTVEVDGVVDFISP